MKKEFTIEWITLVGILNAAKVGYYEDILANRDELSLVDSQEYDALLNLKTFLCFTHGELKIIVK